MSDEINIVDGLSEEDAKQMLHDVLADLSRLTAAIKKQYPLIMGAGDGSIDTAIRLLNEMVGPREAGGSALLEREETVTLLRQACEEYGDNEWPRDLHLADVIERHLLAYIEPSFTAETNDGGGPRCPWSPRRDRE